MQVLYGRDTKKSKICPNCKKKQGGNAKFIILGILVFLILACAIGGKGNSTDTSKDESVKKPLRKTPQVRKQR